MTDFSSVKVGDAVIVDQSLYNDVERVLWGATVSKRTKTRVTVKISSTNPYEITFSNDGTQYPRSSGYIHGFKLLENSTENRCALQRSRLLRCIRNSGYDLDRLLVESKNYRDVDNDQLNQVLQAIETIKSIVKPKE
jgi:hypothetical protein